jgi:steroid 5-alpha reductase family enzyme
MTGVEDQVVVAAVASFVCFGACWLWGVTHGGDASATDAYYGLGSLVHGGVSLLMTSDRTPRAAVLMVLVALWSVGLWQMLARRWLRHHKDGGDVRFQLVRERMKLDQGGLVWKTFGVLVLGQVVLVTVINLPLQLTIASGATGVTVLDAVGLLIVAGAGAVEVLSNRQLAAFKRAKAAGRATGTTLMCGLWSWSRHPNYFGNTAVYFGFFLLAMRDSSHWWTITAPLLVYLMLRWGSGVRLTDWLMLQKRADDPVYLDYVWRTSPFVLRPPRRAAVRGQTFEQPGRGVWRASRTDGRSGR